MTHHTTTDPADAGRHTNSISFPTNSVTHSPGRGQLRAINLFALPCGGFEVRDAFYGRDSFDDRIMRENGDFHHNTSIAAFSTLDEALKWLRESMAHPATDPAKP